METQYKGYNFDYSDVGGTLTKEEYIKMIDLLESYNPKNVCELGSGQSTRVFEWYNKTHNGTKFSSIEHDEAYKGKNTILLPLIEDTNLEINDKIYGNCNKYDGLEKWLSKQDKFDFVLIDGPYGYGFRIEFKYSRIQVISFVLMNKLTDNAIVLYHDSERPNANTTLTEFEKLLKEKGFTFSKEKMNENNLRELTIYKLKKNE